MKKYLIPLISDCIFYAFSLFLLTYLILNYFLPRKSALILGVTFSLAFSLFIFSALKKKKAKQFLSKQEKKNMENFVTLLNFLKKKDILLYLQNLFGGEIKNGRLYDTANKKILSVKFGYSPITKADVVREFNALKNGYSSVIYGEFSQEIVDFKNRFNKKVELKTGEDLFLSLKEKGLLPNKQPPLKVEQKKRYDLSLLLQNKNARKTCVFGILMLIFSYFVPYKTYYLITGGLFLALSLTAKLFGKPTA